MNAPLLTMDRGEARLRLRSYRRYLKTQHDAEYERAKTAYRALARGTPLLLLSEALKVAPRDEKGRPRLAIARADERQIKFVARGTWCTFEPPMWLRWNTSRALTTNAQTPFDVRVPDGYALVPMIPPDIRTGRNLEKCWVIWEVEQWADRILGARPDRDPLLVQRLGTDLYAVLAQWDLTPVEQAVMAGRRLA